MASVYIETSIIGYLTARSRDEVIFKARQELTRAWWNDQRAEYDLVTSQLVYDEAGAGDVEAAKERLALLDGIPLIDIAHQAVKPLAKKMLEANLLPRKAERDAEHVAVATVYRIDYLLTWNCRHIANAETLPRIYKLIREQGFEPPLISTPQEFSGDE